MSSEFEAAESRLITPPPPAASSPLADCPASQNMGDVLAKEHKDDEEMEPSTTTHLDELPTAEEEPAPEASPNLEPPPVPNEKVETVEDRLSGDVGFHGEEETCKDKMVEDRLSGNDVLDGEDIVNKMLECRLSGDGVLNEEKDEMVEDRLSRDGVLNGGETCEDAAIEDRLSGDGLLSGEEERCKDKLVEERLSADGVLVEEDEMCKNKIVEDRLSADEVPDEEGGTCKNEVVEDRLCISGVLNEEVETCKINVSCANEEQQCTALTTDDLCNCEDCKWKRRDLSTEDLEEMMKLRRLGMDLRRYIRYTFNWFTESSGFIQKNVSEVPNHPPDLDAVKNYFELKESVALLCDRVPYHLFMWLVGQAQEFVIIVKFRLITLLHDRNVEYLAEVFLTRLLDGYESLLATADHISELLEPLQKELFSKVNLTWSYINKSLYQNYVYNDPLIQNNLPPFLGQLRKSKFFKHPPANGSVYHELVHRYLAFDEEITKIGILCPEIERLIDKYNAEQLTGSVMKRAREDFEKITTLWNFGQPNLNAEANKKREALKEEDESTTESSTQSDDQNSETKSCTLPDPEIQSMFNDWKKSPQQRLADLVEALTLSSALEEEENKSRASKEKKSHPASLEKTVKEGINKSVSSEKQACKCQTNDATVDAVYNMQNTESQHVQEFKVDSSTNTSDETKAETVVAAVNNEPTDGSSAVQCTAPKQNAEVCKEPVKKVSKTTMAQTAQTQTRHSTTQTPSTNHSQGHVHRHHHQGRCSSHSHLHGSLSNAVFKSSGPHRTHVGHNNHPSAAVTCHKQQHIVEHIKRLSTTDLSPGENGDCSDSGSSHEDSCSVTNSPTPRDSSRHCDCCYCEVFGHGVPSVAPVSRNFNEMRERLRQLLSKKKANGCKVACNPHIKNSVEVSSSSSSLSSSSSTSSTITNVDSANMPNPVSRSNTPVMLSIDLKPPTVSLASSKILNPHTTDHIPVTPPNDHWNIEAAVEFIEGNQGGKKDQKKAEKKARQKQKKLDEKLKKEKVEEERLKLIELQKKTPEVTITVVNPQKAKSQRAVPQQKLPEVSILPTNVVAPQSVFSLSNKQANTAKKKGGGGNSNNCGGCGGDGMEVTSISVKNSKVEKIRLPPSTVVTTATSTTTENVKRKTVSVDQINELLSLSRAKTKMSERPGEPVPQSAVNNIPTNLSNLTKKERKKLRREMLKQEEMKKEVESKKAAASSDNQMQIVTIKRIMESNSAEPTVTITLKGQTPAEDKVLFTLVNGQTKNSSEKSGQQGGNNAGNNTTGKKKKNKANNSANQQQQQGQTANKSQQSQNNKGNGNFITLCRSVEQTKNNKQQQQQQQQPQQQQQQQQQKQANKDKSKAGKQQEDQKSRNQQNANTVETKTTKSKKDKNKNSENKENIMKQVTNESVQKQENGTANKKSNKTTAAQPANQKQQQQQSQQQFNTNKNTKANKNQNQTQNQTQNQNQNQNQKKNNNQINSGKSGKNNNSNGNSNNNSQNVLISKADNQKVNKTAQNNVNKQKQAADGAQSQKKELIDVTSNSNYTRETNNTPSTINIENLKLPPGITITKVDAPVKPLPLKTHSLKAANNSPKQSTIIAAPMSGMQSNYGSPQGTGNVIVVDTGRLKQDLMPKNSEKDVSKDSNQLAASKKKKKKKNKNAAAANGNSNANSQNNKSQQSKDYVNIEPARILHNPSTNMVTIRNPAFGPPPPKMEIPTGQQAAIIKYSENGMVTIRSPALQQAINAGLPPPPKPDFIIKGGMSPNDSVKQQPSHNNSFMGGSELSGAVKGSNGMPLSTDIAELRRRLAQQPDSERQSSGSSTLFNNGLSSIQISKVVNGQSPYIPESGINLKGTSVTLTKIRSTEPPGNHHQQSQQPQQHFEEPKANAVNGNASSKSRKKKKRGNGVRQSGDDWNLVESVFTPKDIDLEDGEMDDAERELEAFKRFCLQSVPPPRKEKVNLNIKDIVLKKKSSSSGSSSAAAVVAAI